MLFVFVAKRRNDDFLNLKTDARPILLLCSKKRCVENDIVNALRKVEAKKKQRTDVTIMADDVKDLDDASAISVRWQQRPLLRYFHVSYTLL